jgi:proton-translocating NAD(P)+ transhydrogenase subunit alpha
MTPTLLAELTIFALAVFLGFELISKVPVVLHTPLMSGTNAIHGIVVIGGILVLGTAEGALEVALGFAATLFGAMNFAGGFVVTDRMLEMFRKKPKDSR